MKHGIERGLLVVKYFHMHMDDIQKMTAVRLQMQLLQLSIELDRERRLVLSQLMPGFT